MQLLIGGDPTAQRRFLHERLGWPETLPEVKHTFVGRETSGPWNTEFLLIETEPGIRLPAVYLSKEDSTGSPVTLIPGRDKAAVTRALERGDNVLAFDLRGIGETRAGKGGNWAWMAGEPWPALLGDGGASWSNWSWFAGRPVPGQWALDMVQAARYCRDKLGVKSIAIDADNDFGWPALLAGAAAPDVINSGRIRLRYNSLHDDIRARGDGALCDVPGLLERLDIPQIRRLWPGQVTVKP